MAVANLRILPPSLAEHCNNRAEILTSDAKSADANTWSILPRSTDIWDYMDVKLQNGLGSWKSPGQAAWAWRASVDPPVKGYIYTDGASQSSSTTPYTSLEPFSLWWPAIFGIVGPDGLVPYYCPALAWANARPWFSHSSRAFAVQGEVPLFIFAPLPPPPPPPPSSGLSLEIEEAAESESSTSASSIPSSFEWVEDSSSRPMRQVNRWTRRHSES